VTRRTHIRARIMWGQPPSAVRRAKPGYGQSKTLPFDERISLF